MSTLPPRQMVFSVPEGGEAVLTFPADPLTIETVDMLAECCALMFRGLRRNALQKLARDSGEEEYASWVVARERMPAV